LFAIAASIDHLALELQVGEEQVLLLMLCVDVIRAAWKITTLQPKNPLTYLHSPISIWIGY